MTIQPGETKRQRLAMKMATGSGKTMAMSLCVVWSYFHALYESDSPMTTSFLVIAPNLIVFERLKSDFGDGATFRRDPLVPPEWSHDFDLAVLLQDDPSPVTARGVLYLTNIQRLYEPSTARGKNKTAPNPVEAMVGPGSTAMSTHPPPSGSSTGSPSASESWSSTTRPITSTTRNSSGTRRSSGCTPSCANARAR